MHTSPSTYARGRTDLSPLAGTNLHVFNYTCLLLQWHTAASLLLLASGAAYIVAIRVPLILISEQKSDHCIKRQLGSWPCNKNLCKKVPIRESLIHREKTYNNPHYYTDRVMYFASGRVLQFTLPRQQHRARLHACVGEIESTE